MEQRINWLAIAAAVVAGVAIGFLWYGLLFQDPWMAGNNFTMEGERMMKNGVEVPMSSTPMVFNVIAMIFYALAMNWLIGRTGATTYAGGATVGAVIGLIMAVGQFTGNLFANNPMSLSMVDGSYLLVLFTVMGAILGGWRRRVAVERRVNETVTTAG